MEQLATLGPRPGEKTEQNSSVSRPVRSSTRSGDKRTADDGSNAALSVHRVVRPRRSHDLEMGGQQAAGRCQQARGALAGSNGTAPGNICRATDHGGIARDGAGIESCKLQDRRTLTVMAGTGELQATDMDDSTDAYMAKDWQTLRVRLRQDGYLLLRGVLNVDKVHKVPHSALLWFLRHVTSATASVILDVTC